MIFSQEFEANLINILAQVKDELALMNEKRESPRIEALVLVGKQRLDEVNTVKNAMLAQKDLEIKEKDSEISLLGTIIEGHKSTIAFSSAQIESLTGQKQTLQDRLHDKDVEIDLKNSEIAFKDAEIEKLKKEKEPKGLKLV